MGRHAAYAHPYDRHVGRYGGQLAAGLIDFAGVGGDDRVLDIGCGTGQLTTALAEAVGEANVAALDPAPGVVEVARARVPGADIRVAAAESVPFADAEFDAVLAQLVVNLVDDPQAAVQEMARVVRPGGAVAACFWDDAEMPLLRVFWDAAQAVAPAELSAINSQAQAGLADVGLLREWWTRAGLRAVTLGEFEVSADYGDFDDLWSSFEAGVGHSGSLYVSLRSDQQTAVRAVAYRRLGSPDGAFSLPARVRTVRGRR